MPVAENQPTLKDVVGNRAFDLGKLIQWEKDNAPSKARELFEEKDKTSATEQVNIVEKYFSLKPRPKYM